jgi:arylsulfatase A-like enzyme
MIGVALLNVLLIVVDDLRPQFGAYGVPYMHTPNVDKLASEGILFEHAYVQQSICAPTRNSFLSGRYPDKTKAWNFLNHFREPGAGENWTALPEFFKHHGYWATGSGKLYHPNLPPNFDEPRSWSEPWPGSFGKCPCGGTGFPPGGQASCEGLDTTQSGCDDDKIVLTAVTQLQMAINGTLGNGKQPFFIAAGFHKPHLPFYAPAKFFALYPEPVAPSPLHAPEGMPYEAWHSCLSNAVGANNSNWGDFSDIPNNMELDTPMPPAVAARLRRGYFASVSYTDDNIGKVLAAAAPILDRTVVVLIGDHGWSLGEQNAWCKMTNWENGVRVPLIFRPPGYTHGGAKAVQLAEAVDLYRTLADLSGIGAERVEGGVDGVSLGPVIANPTPGAVPELRTAARSQFPRCYNQTVFAMFPTSLPWFDRTDCQDTPRQYFDVMGYSIRTAKWRFTEWRHWDGENLVGRWDLPATGTELYAHATAAVGGPVFATEGVNVADAPGNAAVRQELAATLKGLFQITE